MPVFSASGASSSGGLGDSYLDRTGIVSRRADALAALDAELTDILGGAVDDTVTGRAALGSLIAEVNAAVTALGPLGDTPAARRLLIAVLDTALRRADSIVGQGELAAAGKADRVAGLVRRYLDRAGSGAPEPGRSAGPPHRMPAGQQKQWIDEALRVLAQHGYDTRRIDPADIAAIIAHESSGNPHAINLWDSNAAAGTPSKGLMQTIDPTFAAHSLPGHRDIWNPVDNIIAGVRYSIDRYGAVENVPGLARLRGGGGYVGY